mmetsp:Transcript_50936/g.95296  ORF Transcript_50936/g.95296 Transcript_50936/m.95296 type:complete len:339 (-) Transcript_50936:49-1065(-)
MALFVLCLGALLSALGDETPFVPLDDECTAESPCALQATQLRAQRSSTEENQTITELAARGNETRGDLTADEQAEVHVGSAAEGPESGYTAEELLALMSLEQRMNGTEGWGSSSTPQVSYSRSCYSFTGGTCGVSSCNSFRMAQCLSGKCVCPGGCAGADGRCYPSGNQLVASGFTLKNVNWPSYRMYFKRVSTFNQIGTSSMPSFSFMGSDRFDLYRVPGLFNGKALYFLASHKWPEYVLAIRATTGTAFSPFGTYTVKLQDSRSPWKPEDIMLRVCSMVSYGKPNVIMFGSAGSVKTIWSYVHTGSWNVWGSISSPGKGGEWFADPPVPAGLLSPC